jgi:adenosylhomocysteine nucleosidase
MVHAPAARPRYAVLAALAEELAVLEPRRLRRETVQGLELFELDLGPATAIACVGGVGKVNAAHAAGLLLARGGEAGLLVVGVCGGLRRHLAPGTLVHCLRAVQTDLALRAEREVESDPALSAAWQAVAPGGRGWFLTADRPVLSLWRRLRLARAFRGDCVADMETAAAARVASRAGVPWAALRAVTDGATEGGLLEFRKNFAVQAGRAAASLPALVAELEARR